MSGLFSTPGLKLLRCEISPVQTILDVLSAAIQEGIEMKPATFAPAYVGLFPILSDIDQSRNSRNHFKTN
jgi:hypothetical protein